MNEKSVGIYKTYAHAKRAALALGIRHSREYSALRHSDPLLPRSPYTVYKDKWINWAEFLKDPKKIPDYYPTYEQAKKAARALGIRHSLEYYKKYKLDPKLPAKPAKVYPDDWKNFRHFLTDDSQIPKRIPKRYYQSFTQAKRTTRQLGIRNRYEYLDACKHNHQLPKQPDKIYMAEWLGWDKFLTNSGSAALNCAKFQTLDEARDAVQRLGISTAREYVREYRNDHKLPSNPNTYYAEWQGWLDFFGKGDRWYKTLREASKAARELGIETARQYILKYDQDSRLPSCPYQFYKDWSGWKQFLRGK